MSALSFSSFHAISRQQVSRTPEVLTGIFAPDVNLASWQRPADPIISAYCAQLAFAMPLKRIVTTATVQADIAAALPDAPGKAELLADIALQCEMFSCLMDCQQLGLRLETLSKPMCPKFHTDHLVCRLVCTYQGPGTEWQGDSPADHKQATPFAVTLLKGSGWEGNEQQAIVHRSPASDLPRVLLTLDPM
ncbi:hypothetical protein WG68_17875 [Arsukibacterium ikkense]|uniref:Succinylglutamate desuccinylase n=1 Tax=Arsukibacterium ikkense TaxID=336831 RepID=A0A0M2V2U3_9GAMM|nr:DUF1826 domain-containing protein [Arsukibacterium ikkense]KKO43965.1 hypothetical protein WG68_17875 [Arsukibacterium ikkense]